MNNIQSSPVELGQERAEIITDLPSTSAVSIETPSTLDSNILDLLGETPSKNKKYSSPIQAELAVRWEHITTTGLAKDIKKELIEKYLLPENCLKIGSPQLNPEIKAALSEALVRKDRAIQIKQNQQAIAIACIGQALTTIFASEKKDMTVIKPLLDAARLLCDSQYIESMSRRSFVTSTIKKEIKDHLYSAEIDNFLFGEKLADTLRTAKAICKSGAEMKTTAQAKSTVLPQNSQFRNLNFKPPLPLSRQTGAIRRPAPAVQQPRKYQVAPPPPPPLRPHQPSLPPAQSQRLRGRTQIRR